MAERAVVLMSVYAGEDPAYLREALESIAAQTRRPDKFVLVQDGPLGEPLNEVIEAFRGRFGESLEVIHLPQNRGLTAALNEGLKSCDGDLVLRMDSDDVAEPERFERQIDYLERHPEVGVLGCAVLEFDERPERPVRMKPVAVEHEAIARRFPWRNPLNHATVCFRTALVREVGGYPELKYLEDYYLWVKLLCAGARFHNLAEPLYRFRFDRRTLARRAGWTNFRNECFLRWILFRSGHSGIFQFLAACCIQLLLRFAPLGLREWLWRSTRRTVGSKDKE